MRNKKFWATSVVLAIIVAIVVFAAGRSTATDKPDNILQNPEMVVQTQGTWLPKTYSQTMTACPYGMLAMGGGYSVGSNTPLSDVGTPKLMVSTNAPGFTGIYEDEMLDNEVRLQLPDRWVVQGFNRGKQPVEIRVWVVCAETSLPIQP